MASVPERMNGVSLAAELISTGTRHGGQNGRRSPSRRKGNDSLEIEKFFKGILDYEHTPPSEASALLYYSLAFPCHLLPLYQGLPKEFNKLRPRHVDMIVQMRLRQTFNDK